MTTDEALALLETLTNDERAVLLGALAVEHRDTLAATVERARAMARAN